LGNAVPTSAPPFFIKPTSSYIRQPGAIEKPTRCTSLHHEIELGVIINHRGRDIPNEKAMDYVAGYVVALDMTARNLQDVAKQKGLPWTEAKGYDTFCPIGEFIPKEKIRDPSDVNLWLKINGIIRQQGSTNQMIFPIPFLIEYISQIMTLEEGDLILTGTPAGVGPVNVGETLTGGITGMSQYDILFPVIDRPKPNL